MSTENPRATPGALLSAIIIAISGCAAPPPPYRNAAHPAYGDAEFKQDQDACQRENSHPVTHVTGYAEVKGTEVDQDKAQACLAARGWQPATN